MSRYTYTLNPGRREPEQKQTYRRSQLEGMTLFQLREICRRERLVTSSPEAPDREGYIQRIMRFRGQREFRHVDRGCEKGLERLQEFLDCISMEISEGRGIRIPGTILLYEGLELNSLDGYRVESDGGLYEGNLLLVDEEDRIYTCFYLKETDGGFYLQKGREVPVLPLERRQYSFLYFPQERVSEFLYDRYFDRDLVVPGYVEAVRISLLDIQVREVKETELPLVIDFGSSNTTMGICLPDGTSRIARSEEGYVIPSMVGIGDMGEQKPRYVFGCEAARLNRQNYRDEEVPVFYDIKRWVSDPDRRESVILKNGHRYQIPRREMLAAFLEYLIEMGKQQFKCSFKQVQLLSPIRQKEKFQELFRELLPGYQVECVLDEGMAVLFSSIDSLIRQGGYEKGQWYHALVIDCGGGTTDLTSGRFRIDNSRVSYLVDLETSYENGDTNFGGNNLTYRILQLIKIRIVKALKGWVEGNGGEDSLCRLEEEYKRAEAVLPTRFKEYEERSREEYFYVKNNYYYLFELAEEVKKRFFQPEFLYEFQVSTRREPAGGENENLKERRGSWGRDGRGDKRERTGEGWADEDRAGTGAGGGWGQENRTGRCQEWDNRAGTRTGEGVNRENQTSGRKTQAIFLDRWKLSVMEQGRLVHLKEEITFSLYLNEIEEILRPDIYRLMGRFLEQKFVRGELQGYDMIKLTGQSCKSRLFTEALKEYVPGRLIQHSRREKDGAELKMCCLEGALAYFFNRKLGYMKVNQEYQVGTLPYEIMAFTHENQEKVLVKSMDREDSIGYISRFMVGRQLDLYLNDSQGKRLRTYSFTYDTARFVQTTQEEINEAYGGTVIQEETDIIQEGEMKFFVWVSRKKWGFIVLPVLREGELLYRGEETFFAFEDDTWEENFFDGRK